MAERAALITGGSSGIGLAIARALGEDGYALTIAARRPEKLEDAADGLRDEGFEVTSVAANMANEEELVSLAAAHRDAYGRCDVLVNNAGVGIGAPMGELETKKTDLQLDVNLRAPMLLTRECLPMLTEAGEEHRKALILNMASIAGKQGQGWLNVYSATKAGMIGLSQATQKEVASRGIQVTAFCPGFVDTAMTDFVKDEVGAENMIQPQDVAAAVRLLLATSPACLIPEIVFAREGEGI